MKRVRVAVSKPVLESFFIQDEKRAFGIVQGIPKDAKLMSFKFDMQAKQTHSAERWIATFEHESFKDIPDDVPFPFIDVNYQVFSIEERAEVVH